MAGNFGNAYKSVLIRRGAFADLPVLNDGEFGYCYDTEALYIGYGGVNTLITGGGGGGGTLSVATKTSAYTVTNSDDVILVNASSAVNITMQGNSGATSKPYRIKSIGAGVVTILPNGSDTFFSTSSVSSLVLAGPGDAVELIPNKAGLWAVF
jgi:hypothetical protein